MTQFDIRNKCYLLTLLGPSCIFGHYISSTFGGKVDIMNKPFKPYFKLTQSVTLCIFDNIMYLLPAILIRIGAII